MAPGEYVVHVDDTDANSRMLIFARDRTGLEKGIRNWLCFLREAGLGGLLVARRWGRRL